MDKETFLENVKEATGKNFSFIHNNYHNNDQNVDSDGLEDMDYADNIEYTISDDRTKFSFNITQLPGCCGVALVHYLIGFYSDSPALNLVIGWAEYVAETLGYTTVMLTDVDDNNRLKELLRNRSYKVIADFVNQRTDNKVNIYLKDLSE